jgi:hypothetical protein
MDLMVEKKRINTVTAERTWKIIISFITTLERSISMKIFNKLFVRWISISGRGEEEVLFFDDMPTVSLMSFEFFRESRQMETGDCLTHSHTLLCVRALYNFFKEESIFDFPMLMSVDYVFGNVRYIFLAQCKMGFLYNLIHLCTDSLPII